MTSTEITVIVGGLLLGYWIVISFSNRKSTTSADTHSDTESKNGTHQNRTDNKAPDNEKSGEWNSIPASWFRILDVSEGASKEQIVTAYKQMIRQYHPDKVSQMGKEIRDVAEFKSKQINVAYDYAMNLQK